MPKPPPPPAPKGLDEVERAISILDGRHPEHERSRREMAAAAASQRRVLDQQVAARLRRRRRRTLVVLMNLGALAVTGVVAWRLTVRARSIRASLQQVEAPFANAGFAEVASNELTGRTALEASVGGSSCFVAVANGAVSAREGATTVSGRGSVGWCACEPATIQLATSDGSSLALMRIDVAAFGGPLARAWTPAAPSAWADSAHACEEDALDTWIRAGKLSATPGNEGWLASQARAPLRRAGFHVVAGVDPARPFGAVASAAGDCMLAVTGGTATLSLRATGGERAIPRAAGAMAWCGSEASTTTVWRDVPDGAHGDDVVVVAAPGGRIGGLQGVRECAESAGIHVAADAAWVADGDLAWSAASVLRASTLGDVASTALPAEPGDADARVAAIALAHPGKITFAPADAAVACDPSREAAPDERSVVCASSRLVSWWWRGSGATAIARAPMPLWLTTISARPEPDAVARIPEMLALARRLAREGFEPTVLEGVVELTDGVRVVGRAGEDAVVAVGLAAKAPWVFPWTDGIPWDVGDPPKVIALAPGAAVKLTASPLPTAPIDKRRTVVFRRSSVR